MNRYRVFGHTTVTVVIEVDAESELEAYEVAKNELPELIAYGGNGGTDMLIGVDGENESVAADEGIEYDDIEYLGVAEDCNDDDDEEDYY